MMSTLKNQWGNILNYNDKRIIITSRQPAANEFVMHDSVVISRSWMRKLMDYIDKHSNLRVEWIDNEHFVEPSVMGFRLVKKTTDA